MHTVATLWESSDLQYIYFLPIVLRYQLNKYLLDDLTEDF